MNREKRLDFYHKWGWKRTFYSVLILFFSLHLLGDSILRDSIAIEEFERAMKENKHVLLVFSGSDWCKPCIRFNKDILQSVPLMEFESRHLIVLRADFPQRSRLPKGMIARNEWLADKYNPLGLFPKIILLSPDLGQIQSLDYVGLSPELFIAQISELIKRRTYHSFTQQALLMGCGFEFTLVDSIGSNRAKNLLVEGIGEVRRIEGLISEWIDTTEVSRLNRWAGIKPIVVNPEVYRLIDRARILSKLTQGAFDISFHALSDLWHFDGTPITPPEDFKIQAVLKKVGYEKILLLDSSMVYLSVPGMSIGFGGIGKGYAAEKVKSIFLNRGIEDGVINASGDLVAWGKPPDEDFWKVGIANPQDPEEILYWLPIKNQAVATSGDYENFLYINDQRYAHILNPVTGYPTRGIASVTVISSSAELSDALATAIFVLGIEEGLNIIEQLPTAECLIIDSNMDVHISSNLEIINNKS